MNIYIQSTIFTMSSAGSIHYPYHKISINMYLQYLKCRNSTRYL